MKKDIAITHEFVEFIPESCDNGILYVSIPYATAAHNCFCGCGSKVVTPIKPTGWQLTYDGDSISLYPSVGSWQLPCRSHYWIERDRVRWALDMSQEQIAAGRAQDRALRDRYYGRGSQTAAAPAPTPAPPPASRWRRWLNRLVGD